MADQPSGNLEGLTSSIKPRHYSRPTQYIQRSRTGVASDINNIPANYPTNNFRPPESPIPKTKPTAPVPMKSVYIPEQEQLIEQQFTAPVYLNNYDGEYEDVKYKRYSFKMLTKRFVIGSAFAAIILLAGITLVFVNVNNKNIAQAQSSNASDSSQFGGISLSNSTDPINSPPYPSSDQPSSSSIAAYSVAATLPKYLAIPKLNINSMITPVNLKNGNNFIGAPDNIFNVGWWQQSSLPGQTGSVVLDGFTSNGTISGVFSSITSLKIGDNIQIVEGNNSKVSYKVLKISNFGQNGVSMEQAITPINATQPSLNIITCSGQTSTCPSSTNDMVIFAQQQ